MACDTTAVVPTPSICDKAITMKVRLPAMPTAATASVPSRPTQNRSMRKYSVWKAMVTSMKPVVLSRCRVMEPVVRSCMATNYKRNGRVCYRARSGPARFSVALRCQAAGQALQRAAQHGFIGGRQASRVHQDPQVGDQGLDQQLGRLVATRREVILDGLEPVDDVA